MPTDNDQKLKQYHSIEIPEENVKPEQLSERLHSVEAKVAYFITDFAGSMPFFYLHVVWFSFWISVNHGLFAPYLIPFDPFPYGLLTMIVSLEAIFLSTFIMVAQNRQALVDTVRELEDEKEQEEEEMEQEELEQDVQDIQGDLNEIKKALTLIQDKIAHFESKSSK